MINRLAIALLPIAVAGCSISTPNGEYSLQPKDIDTRIRIENSLQTDASSDWKQDAITRGGTAQLSSNPEYSYDKNGKPIFAPNTKLPVGTPLMVGDRSGGWWEVSTSDGKTGWLEGAYILFKTEGNE